MPTQTIRRPTLPLSVPLFWVIAFALAPMVIMTTWPGGYVPLSWCVGGMLACIVRYEWRRVRHPVTPAGIIGLGGLLLFFLRPLTIASLGTTTAGASAQTSYFNGDTAKGGHLAIVEVWLFFAIYGAVYLVLAQKLQRSPKVDALNSEPAPVTRSQVTRARFYVWVTALIAAASVGYLVSSAGGISAYLSAVAFRTSFFAGHFYLTVGYVPLACTLVVYVILARRADIRVWSASMVLAALLLIIAAFATGGRGPLLLGALAPLVALKQVGPRPFRSASLGVLGLVALIGALLMSLLLRTNVYTDGAAAQELQQSPVSTLLNTLTSGSETRPFDSLVLLNTQYLEHNLPLQFGTTYAKAPTWFLPSAIYPGKDGGANTWFTKKYLPDFYYPDHVETSVSAIGEAFINFAWWGIIGLAVLLAVASTRVDPSLAKRGPTSAAMYVLLTPLFFSFIRGDAFGNLSLALFTGVVGALAMRSCLRNRVRLVRPLPQIKFQERDSSAPLSIARTP